MARRLTLRDILDRLEVTARDAFVAAIRDSRTDIDFAAFVAAIDRGDVNAAMAAIALNAAYFEPLSRALRDAAQAGGDHAFAEVARAARAQGGGRVVGRFDAFNPEAERLLRHRSSGRIVEIADDVRATVREVLGDAMRTDASPRKVALDIVGRLNRATGQREGGIVGLTRQQAGYVQNAKTELLSGDPVQMRAYLGRQARNWQFDPIVNRAIREGRGVAAADADVVADRYSANLLRLRGEAIGRTEVLGTIHAARDQGLRQMVEAGSIRADAITLVWDAAHDEDTRSEHRGMDKQPRKLGDPFVSPSGYRLRYPGDSELGAPASMVINCRCSTRTEMNLIAGLKGRLTPEELAEARAAM